jgi:hypothetical protein
MFAHTAKNIQLGLHEIGAHIAAGLRHVSFTSILLFVTATAWLIGAGWWNYVRPQQFDLKAYERYQDQLADCRELNTSESRYNCVAETLIGRDQTNFGRAMIVFLPPLVLLFGHYILREIRVGRREREHAALAERHAREQILKMRAEMRAERAAAAEAAKAMIGREDDRNLHGPHAALLSHGQPIKRA